MVATHFFRRHRLVLGRRLDAALAHGAPLPDSAANKHKNWCKLDYLARSLRKFWRSVAVRNALTADRPWLVFFTTPLSRIQYPLLHHLSRTTLLSVVPSATFKGSPNREDAMIFESSVEADRPALAFLTEGAAITVRPTGQSGRAKNKRLPSFQELRKVRIFVLLLL